MRSRTIIASTLSASLLMPAVVFGAIDAQWIQGAVQRAHEGNAEVIIEHSSSVSTGGQTVKSGDSVHTGSASASSKIETKVQSSSSGGTVKIKVETEKNGVTKTEEYEKSVGPGERIDILQGTSWGAPHAKPQVKGANSTRGNVWATSSAFASSSVDSGTAAQPRVENIVEEPRSFVESFREIPRFFKRVFSFIFRF